MDVWRLKGSDTWEVVSRLIFFDVFVEFCLFDGIMKLIQGLSYVPIVLFSKQFRKGLQPPLLSTGNDT